MSTTVPQLRDPSLFIGKNYINDEWVDSTSSKTFNVYGKSVTYVEKLSPSNTHVQGRADNSQTLQQGPSSAPVPNPSPKMLKSPSNRRPLLFLSGGHELDEIAQEFCADGTTWSSRTRMTSQH